MLALLNWTGIHVSLDVSLILTLRRLKNEKISTLNYDLILASGKSSFCQYDFVFLFLKIDVVYYDRLNLFAGLTDTLTRYSKAETVILISYKGKIFLFDF